RGGDEQARLTRSSAPRAESFARWRRGTMRGRASPRPDPRDGPGRIRLGYPVTVSDCVDTGPAPAPGKADPTPLNITSLTVYRPGRWYTCVGDWPEPVVPSPNSHR